MSPFACRVVEVGEEAPPHLRAMVHEMAVASPFVQRTHLLLGLHGHTQWRSLPFWHYD